MSLRNIAIKGAVFVAFGRSADRSLQLIRNIIVARLISPEDFGIAALFAITISFLEMVSNLAVDTLLVQSPHGEAPGFQQTSQLMMSVRGFAVAILILICAEPVARLFDIPQAAWAFRVLAIVPLIRGLAHQDMIRFQREMNFKYVLLSDVSSQLVAALIAWPLAAWLRDYSAILYLILLQTCTRTIASHIVAQRRYTLCWDLVYARQIISFGWPLLINGVLLFLIMQGDRFVIGAADTLFSTETYTKALLGFYSAAFVLSSSAIEGIWSVISPVILPLLSKVQGCEKRFRQRADFCILLATSIAGPLSVFFILLGGWVMVLIFGDQYGAAEPLIIMLGAAQSIRLIRLSLTMTSLAKGDSRIPTICNVFRISSFLLCFVFAAKGFDIVWIAGGNLLGEFFAIAGGIIMIRYRLSLPVLSYLKSFIIPSLGLTIGFGLWNAGWVSSYPAFAFLLASALSVFMLGAFVFFFGTFRRELATIWHSIMTSKLGLQSTMVAQSQNK